VIPAVLMYYLVIETMSGRKEIKQFLLVAEIGSIFKKGSIQPLWAVVSRN
jgi:hypothetical protein